MKKTAAVLMLLLLLILPATFHILPVQSGSFFEKWVSPNSGGEDTIQSMVVDNGFIYVQAGGIFGSTMLYCLDEVTGNQVWNYSLGYLTFIVANGHVYLGGTIFYTTASILLCLDASSGAELWKSDLEGDVETVELVEDRLFVTAGATVYVFDSTVGARVWAYSVPDDNSIVSLSVKGDYVCILSNTHTYSADLYYSDVYALDASTGHKLWSQRIWRATSPASYPSSINITYSEVIVCQRIWPSNNEGSGSILAFNIQNGSLLWKYGVHAAPSDFTVVDDIVYCATSSGGVFAVNASDGSEIWSIKDELQFGSMRFVDGYLYVGFNQGVSCFDAVNGARVWSYRASDYNVKRFDYDDTIYLSPTVSTVSEGIVYFGWNGPQGWLDTKEHEFYALNACTGAFLWDTLLSYRFEAEPVVANNTLYLGGSAVTTISPTWVEEGAVIAINPPVTSEASTSVFDITYLLAGSVIVVAAPIAIVIIFKNRSKLKRVQATTSCSRFCFTASLSSKAMRLPMYMFSP